MPAFAFTMDTGVILFIVFQFINVIISTIKSILTVNGSRMTAQLRRLLEASGQKLPDERYILELNPKHALIAKAASQSDEERFKLWADFIYQQALLADQGTLKDPAAFVKTLDTLLLD